MPPDIRQNLTVRIEAAELPEETNEPAASTAAWRCARIRKARKAMRGVMNDTLISSARS